MVSDPEALRGSFERHDGSKAPGAVHGSEKTTMEKDWTRACGTYRHGYAVWVTGHSRCGAPTFPKGTAVIGRSGPGRDPSGGLRTDRSAQPGPEPRAGGNGLGLAASRCLCNRSILFVVQPQGVPASARFADELDLAQYHAERWTELAIAALRHRTEVSAGRTDCLDCGDTIPLERLTQVPHASRCTRCQDRHERQAAAFAPR
jgi:hypothetical protein